MEIQETVLKAQQDTRSNFGKWGWSMIVYCAISYYIAAAIGADGLNFFPGAFEALRDGAFNSSLITTLAGLAGWTAVIGGFLFGFLVEKMGARSVAVIANILTGIFVVIFGITTNFSLFILMMFLSIFITGSAQMNVVPNTIMNVWFPKKKGLALGWATMGLPICTATIVIILQVLMKITGSIANAYVVIGIAIILFGIISIFWCKNSPEEVGVAPDNLPMSADEIAKNKAKLESHVSKWTVKKLLTNKTVWGIGLGLGLLWMTTVGIVTQLVPRIISIRMPVLLASGMSVEAASAVALRFGTIMLTFSAIAGIFGSYFWGYLDQRFGTKKACYLYGVWYIVSLILLILQPYGGVPLIIISVLMAGVGIGGIGNLIPSMIGTCFGRYDFAAVNKVIAPINTIVRCTGIIVAGIMSGTVYGYSGAYAIFIVTTLIGILMIGWIKPELDEEEQFAV